MPTMRNTAHKAPAPIVATIRRRSAPGFTDLPILAAGRRLGVLWCVREPPHAALRRQMAAELAALPLDVPASFWDFGAGNGYALIPPDHPWRADVDIEDARLAVHRGLTYADAYGWVGFDTSHPADTLDAWPLSRVVAATRDMAAQVARGAAVEAVSDSPGV